MTTLSKLNSIVNKTDARPSDSKLITGGDINNLKDAAIDHETRLTVVEETLGTSDFEPLTSTTWDVSALKSDGTAQSNKKTYPALTADVNFQISGTKSGVAYEIFIPETNGYAVYANGVDLKAPSGEFLIAILDIEGFLKFFTDTPLYAGEPIVSGSSDKLQSAVEGSESEVLIYAEFEFADSVKMIIAELGAEPKTLDSGESSIYVTKTTTITYVATNKYGTKRIVRSAEFKAAASPQVTLQPVAKNSNKGETLTLASAFSGNPSPAYQWYESDTLNGNYTQIQGQTTNVLNYPNFLTSKYFYCTATNGEGDPASTTPVLITAVGVDQAAPILGTGDDTTDKQPITNAGNISSVLFAADGVNYVETQFYNGYFSVGDRVISANVAKVKFKATATQNESQPTVLTMAYTPSKTVPTVTLGDITPPVRVGDADKTLTSTTTGSGTPVYGTSDSSKAVIVDGNKLHILDTGSVDYFVDYPGTSSQQAVRATKIINILASADGSSLLLSTNYDTNNAKRGDTVTTDFYPKTLGTPEMIGNILFSKKMAAATDAGFAIDLPTGSWAGRIFLKTSPGLEGVESSVFGFYAAGGMINTFANGQDTGSPQSVPNGSSALRLFRFGADGGIQIQANISGNWVMVANAPVQNNSLLYLGASVSSYNVGNTYSGGAVIKNAVGYNVVS